MEQQTNLGHLMVDIETLGDESNSVIVSIGALEFDINTGQTGRRFYRRIDIDSCLQAGLKVNGGTIRWWMDKSEKARQEIAKGGDHLSVVLIAFTSFIAELDPDTLQLWSRGQRFDIGLLEDAYKAGFLPTPWSFRGERDVRTLEALRPAIYKAEIRDADMDPHLPIGDCMFQIGYCSKIWQDINQVQNKIAA
jgi:exodeoxyribonuclease VIII